MMEVSQTPALSLQELQSKNSSSAVLPIENCELDETDKVHSKEIIHKENEEKSPVKPVEEASKGDSAEKVIQNECNAVLNGDLNGDAADEEDKLILSEEKSNGPVENEHKTSSEDTNTDKQEVEDTKGECEELISEKNEASIVEPTNSEDNSKPNNVPESLDIAEKGSSPVEAVQAVLPAKSDDIKDVETSVASKIEEADDSSLTKQSEIEVDQKKPEDVITIDDDKVLGSNVEAMDEQDDFLSKLNSAIGDDDDEQKCEEDKTPQKSVADELDDDIILIDSPMRQESPEKYKEKEESKLTPKENEKSDADPKPKNSEVEVKQKEDVLESDDDDVVLLDLLNEKPVTPKQTPVEKGDNEKPEITSSATNNEVEANKKEDPPIAPNEDDDDDDDVVFIECDVNDSSNIKKTEKMKEESKTSKEYENEKQILDDDDVVLLDDDKMEDNGKTSKKDDEGEDMDSEEILTIKIGPQKPFEDVSMNDSSTKVDPVDEKCEDDLKSVSNKSETKQSNFAKDTSKIAECESKNKEKIVSDNSDNAQDKLIEGGSDSNKDTKSDDGNARDQLLKISTSSRHSQSSDSLSSINKPTNDENSTTSKSKQPSGKRKIISEDSSSSGLSPSGKVEAQLGNSESFHAKDDLQDEIKALYVKPSKSNSLKRSISPFENADISETKKPKLLEPLKDECNDEKDDKKDIKESAMSLEFLKKFKSPLSTMTRSQLEELVLQKVTEALVYKSEFSQLYEIIDKQEQMLKTYQNKCTELTKQFRDLEMVHSRVAKDLQSRNSQFVMPVKITRAVGLQVLVPKNNNKALEGSTSNLGSSVGNSTLPANQIANKADQNPQRGRCMQKTTPLRPVPDTIQQQGGVQQITLNRNLISMKQNVNLTPTQTFGSQNKIVYKPVRPENSIIGGHSQPEQSTTVVQTIYPAQLQVVQTGPPMTQIPNNSASHMLNTVRKSTAAQQQFSLATKTLVTPADRLKVPPVVLKKNGTNGRMSVTVSPVAPVSAVPQNSPPVKGNKSFIDLTDDEEAFPKKLQAQSNLPALVAIPTNNNSGQFAAHQPKTSPQRATAVNQNGTASQRVASVKTNNFSPKQTTSITAVTNRVPATPQITRRVHPAPLPKAPPAPTNPSWKAVPPNPRIRINNIDSGIVISWTMDDMSEIHADVALYQIYAYQETSAAPSVDSWRHVGDVRALLLPMAVTLTQFQEGQRYYFAVRAVDVHNRYGPFSSPKTWL